MTIALRSAGALASVTTGSVAPAFGTATQAGNMLVAVVWTGGVSGVLLGGGSTGWVQAGNGTVGAFVFYKPNCGASESPPTFGATGGSYYAAALAEVTGAATSSPVDKAFVTNGSNVATNTSADALSTSDLVVVAFSVPVSKTATLTSSVVWAPTGGSLLTSWTDGATKQLFHGWGGLYLIAGNGGSAVDSATGTFTPSTGAINAGFPASTIASFGPFVAGATAPSKPIVCGQAVQRASSW